MGREAQGKSCALWAERSEPCFPGPTGPRSRPLLCRRVGTARQAALMTLASLCSQIPALPLVPGTCPTRWCFQHLRRGAKPLLHSRKIFVQGLGTRRRGNKSHLGAEQAVLPRCFVCPSRSPLRPERGLPSGASPGIPPHTGWLWG